MTLTSLTTTTTSK